MKILIILLFLTTCQDAENYLVAQEKEKHKAEVNSYADLIAEALGV